MKIRVTPRAIYETVAIRLNLDFVANDTDDPTYIPFAVFDQHRIATAEKLV
jgi:hypothetical protein